MGSSGMSFSTDDDCDEIVLEADDPALREAMIGDQWARIKELAAQGKFVVYRISEVEYSGGKSASVHHLHSVHDTAALAHIAEEAAEAEQAAVTSGEKDFISVWDKEQNDREKLSELEWRSEIDRDHPF
jgi:hypothetical protein